MNGEAINSDQIFEGNLSFDEIRQLEDKQSIRIRRTRDFRIDTYKSQDNANSALDDPERKKRVANHKRRVHQEQRAEWALNIKIRDGWVCTWPDCGELDRKLLEAHHEIPIHEDPSKEFDLDNGKTRCLWHHALSHSGAIRDRIKARLCDILVKRHYRHWWKNKSKSKLR